VTVRRFEGKKVIVTGAGQGIGRAIAERFAAEAADVMLIGPDRAVRLGRGELLREPAGIFHVIVGVLVGDGRHLDQLGAG